MSFKKFSEFQEKVTSPIAYSLRETIRRSTELYNELLYGEIPSPTDKLTLAIKQTEARSKTIIGLQDIAEKEKSVSWLNSLVTKVKNLFK